MNNNQLIVLEKVNAFYGRRQSLFNISLQVPMKAVTLLLGANGAGKTTLFRAICNMVATTGRKSFAGQDISELTTEGIALLGIAHVPEGRGTFLDLTVEENLKLGAYSRSDRKAIKTDMDLCYNYFPVLKKRRGETASVLSGGEQQMLAIGRALMMRPKVILVDEPSMGLAPLVIRDIFSMLHQLNQKEHVGVVIIEQNAAKVIEFADHVHLISNGQVVQSGTASEFKGSEVIQKVYLGI